MCHVYLWRVGASRNAALAMETSLRAAPSDAAPLSPLVHCVHVPHVNQLEAALIRSDDLDVVSAIAVTHSLYLSLRTVLPYVCLLPVPVSVCSSRPIYSHLVRRGQEYHTTPSVCYGL